MGEPPGPWFVPVPCALLFVPAGEAATVGEAWAPTVEADVGEGKILRVALGEGAAVVVAVGVLVAVGDGVLVTVGDGVFVTVGDGVLVSVGDGVVVTVGDGVLVAVPVGLPWSEIWAVSYAVLVLARAEAVKKIMHSKQKQVNASASAPAM